MIRIVLTAALLVPGLASGQTPEGEKAKVVRQLNEKQAALLQRLDRVERLNAVYGKLQAVRDRAFTDPANLYQQSIELTDAQLEWIKGWYAVLGLLDSITPANASQVLSDVQTSINSQASSFVAINRQWAAIHNKAANLADSFASIQSLPQNYLAGYEAQILQINDHIGAVAAGLAMSESSVDNTKLAEWQDASRLTRQAVFAKLKLLALEHSELEKYVNLTSELFKAEDVLSPMQQSSYKTYRAFRDSLLEGRVFETKNNLQALQAKVDESLKAIQSSGLDGKYTTPVVDTLNQWNRSALEQYTKLTALGEELQVARFAEKTLRKVATKCKDPDIQIRKTVNCELYRTLVRISRQQIIEMDAPTLEYFENQIVKATKPPRVEGI